MVPVTLSWSKEPVSLTSRGSAEADDTCSRSPERTGVLLARSEMILHTMGLWDEQWRWAWVTARGQKEEYKPSWIITSLLLISHGKHSFYVRLYSAVLGKIIFICLSELNFIILAVWLLLTIQASKWGQTHLRKGLTPVFLELLFFYF